MKASLLLLALSTLLIACGAGSDVANPSAATPVLAATVEENLSDEGELGLPQGEVAEPDAPEGAPDAQAANYAIRNYGPSLGHAMPLGAGTTEAQVGASTVLYVAPTGSDRNPGTLALPFRSIGRAAKASRPGSRVLVAPGVYSGGFRTTVSGDPAARILFLSTSKWGARITPPQNSPNKAAWDNRGSHVDIVGFEVDGSQYQGGKRWTQGIYNGGSYVSIRNNHVHHIATNNVCTRGGGAAINVDSYFRGVRADVIANLVHDIGPAGCRYVQGIYVSTSARVMNNVVYRVAEGGIHLWHDASNVIITNNTVTRSNTGIIIGGGNFYHSSGPNDHTAVYSNIVYDNKMGISEQGRTGRNNTYRNNLVYQNSSYNWRLSNGLKHNDTVSSPPMFVDDARSLHPSLKLSVSSPAIGRGTSLHAESTDFAGRPRDAKAGYDIGALQHE